MFRRTIATLFVATSAFAITACGASYDVVQRAEPNPFSCRTSFTVMPISYEGLQVGKKTEDDYLFTKSEKTKAAWQADKHVIDREFSRTLVKNAAETGIHVDVWRPVVPSSHYVIQPKVYFVEPGFFAGPAMHASEVMMTVVITTREGLVLDEVELDAKTMGSIAHPTTRSRFESDGEKLAEALAEYLETRVKEGRGRVAANCDFNRPG